VIDTEKLQKAVDHFVFASRVSNRDLNRPVTAEELERVINEISKLMKAFINELESQ